MLLGKRSTEQQTSIDYWLDWGCGQLKVYTMLPLWIFMSSFHSGMILQSAVHSTVAAGEPTHDLLTCLGRLESHLSLGHHYLIPEGLSLADIAVWSRLYVLLSPDNPQSQGTIHGTCSFITRDTLEHLIRCSSKD